MKTTETNTFELKTTISRLPEGIRAELQGADHRKSLLVVRKHLSKASAAGDLELVQLLEVEFNQLKG